MIPIPLLETKNPDAIVGPSPCCPGSQVRHSDPCNADYCETCDRWLAEPKVVPTTLGPSWKRDSFGRFVRPKHSLGPQIAAWVTKYVKSPTGEGPWRFSPEQLRLLYWIYAIDERGRWIYREMTIQRLKGWG